MNQDNQNGQENPNYNNSSSNFGISVNTLKEIVNKWLQREHGSDDIDMVQEQGGVNWLEKGLNSSIKNGIDTSSLDDRKRFFGSNEKEKIRVKGFWELSWIALDDLILRILLVAGVASIIIHVIMEEDHRSTAWIEGFAILLAVVIVVFVTAYNDLKKEKEFQKLNEEAENGKKISVIRDGKEVDDLKIGQIVVGDLVIIKSGIEIPGDGIMISGFSVQVDESSMTGETKPMNKDTLERCLKKKDELFKKGVDKVAHHAIPSVVFMAGTKILNGTGLMMIINVGNNSSIGKIKDILTSGEEELTPLQLKLEKIARDIGIFGLISAVLIFIVLVIRLLIEGGQEDWDRGSGEYIRDTLEYFIIGITILVVAIPEGLPLAVTLSLAFSVNKMMEDKNLVRRLQACETMGGANIICSDKTGTLTRNEMYLTHFWNGKERTIFDPTTDKGLPFADYIKGEEAIDLFKNTIALNSNEDPNKKDGNPTEMAILKYMKSCNFDVVDHRSKYHQVFQAVFSSDRKRMSTIVKMDNGKHFIFMKGASEYMIEVCDEFLEFDTGNVLKMNYDLKNELEASVTAMATQALRTIGLCYKEIDLDEIDLENKDQRGIFHFEKDGFTMEGNLCIKDIIRKEVPLSIKKCHKAGITVKMVTGDNKITARAIAKEVGIITPENEEKAIVMEGPDFLRLIGGVICANCRDKEGECDCVKNKQELDKPENKGKKIRKDTIEKQGEFDKIWRNLLVLARSRPEDKYALVIGLRERHNVVAVTGDGTNDAPALSKADVGFAMNIAGTEVAKQAADILIMDDNFASIVQAVKWGRNIYDSIRKFLQFQLTVNVVAVLTTFISAIILKEAILSAVQMLWINLIMDTLAALALATEPPSESLLNRHPHGRNDYIISPLMMKHIVAQSLYQSAILFVLVFAGEHFLFDYIGDRQTLPGDKTIVNGRAVDGYKRENWDNQFSVHYTYNFNIFVFLQLFNFINCRVLDDSFNVFKDITKSTYFLVILAIIFVLQILFLSLCGPAIRVVQWGLDPLSWLLCMVIGSTSLLIAFIFKFIPLEKILPGGGNKEIDLKDLNKMSSMSLRKRHDSEFFKNKPGLIKTSSIIEDKKLN